MKKFLVYLLVIVLTVSLGFAIFYLVRDNEVISISSASIYRDAGESFVIDIEHNNKKANTEITVTSSDDNIVKGEYDEDNGQYKAVAVSGGVARINVRTTNAKFRNLWCDVIVGDGTVDSPFYISNATQLAAIGMGEQIVIDGVAQDAYYGFGDYKKYRSDACYKLVADIDASTVNNGYWVPLQNFTGRFDGNGLTIKNIYIDAEGYKTAMGDSADVRFDSNKDAGIFENIGAGSIVYNFKVENFMAVGAYSNFGVIAGENNGTIERVEVKDAYCSVITKNFGGIAGLNESTEGTIKNSTTNKDEFVINTAKIDRTSVNNLVLGQKIVTDESGNTSTEVVGAVGNVGGIVGINNGGNILYSYVKGEVYLGNSTSTQYGGVAGVVWYATLINDLGNKDVYEYQGANVRDCYADIIVHTDDELTKEDVGGAIGLIWDSTLGTSENGNKIVYNYIMGVYYNKESLNNAEEGETKDFGGIGLMLTEGNPQVNFTDGKYVVYGLTTEEMKNPENFVSYVTKEYEFNEDGTSKGVVDKKVAWLFDSVWAISTDTNNGMPYLNYQLTYAPDDFSCAGVPVISNNYDDYFYEIQIQYPIDILSGVDGKLKIQEQEYYQLVYSPEGINITWKSSDTKVVYVTNKGKIYGVKPGSATITATTESGSVDTITVIVEKIPYSISAPETIYLQNGESYNLNNITITPTPSEISYSVVSVNTLNEIASISGKRLVANSTNVGSAILIISVDNIDFYVNVEVTELSEINLTAYDTGYNEIETISGYINEISKTGTIVIDNDKNLDLFYNATCESGEGVVDLRFDDNNSNVLNYTINTTGSATVKIYIETEEYKDMGSLYIYFDIKDDEKVNLTVSQSQITGYFDSIEKTGSVTVQSDSGANLSYEATSNNTEVVTVEMADNSMNYTIKKAGNATVTIKVTTEHYLATGYVYFTILENTTVVVDTIKLSSTSITIKEGQNFQLTATGNFTSLTWTSSAKNVATVTEKGNVYGVGAGEATITAKSDTAEARCVVYVEKETEKVSISLSPTSLNLTKGETYKLKTSGSYSSVAWSSSNSSVVSVDSNGNLTAKAVGSAKITVAGKNSNGETQAYAYSYITVTEPTTISLTTSSTSCNVGDVITITAVTNNSVTVDWTYDDTLADFDEEGNVLTITTTKGASIEVIASADSVSTSTIITVTDVEVYSKYIYNVTQLNAMRYFPSEDFVLCNNLTVGNWTPIDDFSGSLTTANNAVFTLKDITVSDATFAGLFGNNFTGTVSGLNIVNANINGSYAGAIAGKSSSAKISACYVRNSKITGELYAGGVVGYAGTLTTFMATTSGSNTVIATNKLSNVGGIVGYATGSSMLNCNVNAGSAKLGSNAHGYAGGVAGYIHNTRVSRALVNNSFTVYAGNSTIDFAGGISGYTYSANETITGCTVEAINITGYNAGGISGGLTSSQVITLEFDVNNRGYRYEDLSNSSYQSNVNKTAVKETVVVTGSYAGGLFGIINSGVVENCYARAEIKGNASGAMKAGFAVNIHASSAFGKDGGTGTGGLVINCYSACTFSGSGDSYAVTASLVHSNAGRDSGNKDGYCMNYVFDEDKADGATYRYWPGLYKLLSKDYVGASKSSTEMQTTSTYTNKNFSSTIWNLSSGYPTLKNER